ncbi:MAG: hypothetical protein DA446_07910 [Bacteroidetes bacterium]|nr:MAG: hypothetical protein DA446_07910 [Bacteroidota bacterium]
MRFFDWGYGSVCFTRVDGNASRVIAAFRMCRQYFPGDAKIAKFPRIARLNTWARLRLASTRNLTKWL